MKLTKETADIFVPDGAEIASALARTTHLGVGAHQDDLEFMATHGILACFGQAGKWFAGVTCTDGAGSSRTGVYADYTDGEMKAVRRVEQRAAAMVGRYGAMLQLDFSSKEVKARDAVVIGIAAAGDEELEKYVDHVIHVPETDELLIPILTVVPLQLLAYYAAITRGCDVDKPRNLAKSVTVE